MNLTEYAQVRRPRARRAGGQGAGDAEGVGARRPKRSPPQTQGQCGGRDLSRPDRRLDEKTLANGPFRGVPFLIKDIGQHLEGGSSNAAAG